MSRLSSIDAFWINAESDGPPFAIGALVVLDGPAPGLDQMQAFLAARIVDARRMRQRLAPDSLRIRQPEWEDAEPDLNHHVREVTLGGAAGQADLERAVAGIMRTPMDLDRPLWDFTIITGLADGTWAAVSRLHHTVADGQGALLLTGRLIDIDAEGSQTLTDALDALMTQVRAAADRGDDGTSRAAFLAEAAKRGGDLALRALRTIATSPDRSEALAEAASALSRQAETVAAQLPGRAGVLQGTPGQQRSWTTTQVSLADVKRIRTALGGTVNDIVMTLMSGGYRALLRQWDLDPDAHSIRVLVPVSLRSPGDLASNNQVSALLVVLPLAGDTVSRLGDIRAHLDAVKDLGGAAMAAPIYEAIDRTVPAFVQTYAVRALSGAVGSAFTETLVTNVPGPQFPVYVAGRRVRSLAPLIPIGDPWRLNTGVVSYDGELNFGITGGEGVLDDVRVVAAGIQEALADLLAATGAAGAPRGV